VADVSSHSDLGPELRQLAQVILDRLDPAVRAAATMASDALRGPGRCQQVWCPVCALAALVSGEQHPMLNVIAEHSVALMAVVRSMAADPSPRPGPTETPPPVDTETPPNNDQAAAATADPGPPPATNGRYHRIDIVIESVVAEPGAGDRGDDQ
jgi:hypothetical protein